MQQFNNTNDIVYFSRIDHEIIKHLDKLVNFINEIISQSQYRMIYSPENIAYIDNAVKFALMDKVNEGSITIKNYTRIIKFIDKWRFYELLHPSKIENHILNTYVKGYK